MLMLSPPLKMIEIAFIHFYSYIRVKHTPYNAIGKITTPIIKRDQINNIYYHIY